MATRNLFSWTVFYVIVIMTVTESCLNMLGGGGL